MAEMPRRGPVCSPQQARQRAAPLPSHLASPLSAATLHFSSPFPANHRPFGGVHERCHSWSQPNACTTPSPWVFSPPAPILAASQRPRASEALA